VLHLIHPALVHATAAFLVAGGLVEAIGILAKRPAAERFGSAMTLIGTASLVPTIAAGFLAEFALTVPPEAADLLARHENLGFALLAVFLTLLVVRGWGRGRVPDELRIAYAVTLLAGVALVVAAAFVGGSMVYGFGLGVSR
jgi:uncharacterized membrane protein